MRESEKFGLPPARHSFELRCMRELWLISTAPCRHAVLSLTVCGRGNKPLFDSVDICLGIHIGKLNVLLNSFLWPCTGGEKAFLVGEDSRSPMSPSVLRES